MSKNFSVRVAGKSRHSDKPPFCYDCYGETLEKKPIVGKVFEVRQLIYEVSVCRKHKIKHLQVDREDHQRQIERIQDEIKKLSENGEIK